MTEKSVMDIGNLSQPITKLIEVVSAGVGALYEPTGIVRQAKAQAKAAIIRADAEGQVRSIQARAAMRLEHREAMRQENIERVSALAVNELPPNVSARGVDQDWTTQFFDNVQDVSDEDLHVLWSRILAGEIASPVTYSKRTLSFLRTLEKWEAAGFTEVCALALTDSNGWKVIFREEPYRRLINIKYQNRDVEGHLVAIGLLGVATGLPDPSSFNGAKFDYFGTSYLVTGPPAPQSNGLGSLEIGPSVRSFSKTGWELSKIAGAAPIDGYMSALSEHLRKEYGIRFERVY